MSWFSDLFARNTLGGKAIQADLTTSANLNRVVVHVTWGRPDDPGLLGSTKGPMLLNDGEYHAYVMCPKPRDFNDFNALETLGHECFHAFGARHE